MVTVLSNRGSTTGDVMGWPLVTPLPTLTAVAAVDVENEGECPSLKPFWRFPESSDAVLSTSVACDSRSKRLNEFTHSTFVVFCRNKY